MTRFTISRRTFVGGAAGAAGLTAFGARAQAQSLLCQNILDVFHEHGVQILSPHYLGDPDEEKVVPPSRWFESPARPPQEAKRPAASGPA